MSGLAQTPVSEFILRAITFLIAMTVHEFAHAYGAYRMGDTTARDMGRMTLNPFVNIDWFGFLSAVFIGFGFLGSAPVNEARMHNRRWGMLVAVAAGPISNLLLAIVVAIPFWFGFQSGVGVGRSDIVPTLGQIMIRLLEINLILFLFNLLPLFPLDGWTIMLKLLPPDVAYKVARYQRESTYVFFGLIFLSFVGFNLLGQIIFPPLNALASLILSPRSLFSPRGGFNVEGAFGLLVCVGLLVAAAVVIFLPYLRRGGSSNTTRRRF